MDMDMKKWSLKGYEPRTEQVKIIDEIESAMGSGYTNIILEAGLGVGKSAIATTIANMVYDSYICTMTNQLQEQYVNDFDYMLMEIKGRSNYYCNYGGTCQDCEMDKQNEKHCPDCPYTENLKDAQNHANVITNYDYLYYAGNYAKQLDTRKLLVLDEAHNFEKKMMQLVSEDLNRYLIYENYGFDIFESITKGDALKNINNKEYWIPILEKCIDKETMIMTYNKKEEKDQQSKIQKYKRMIKKLEKDYVIELPLRKDIIADKEKKDRLKMTIKPLTTSLESYDILKFGDTRLFMTGTLGSKKKFCEWNGLDENDTYYIYQKSPFPVENRPIIKKYVCSMKQEAWRNPHILKYIQKIIDAHKGEKGVIHTASNSQAWFIKKGLNSKKIWVAQGQSRMETIRKFEESNTDLCLIGAGLKDGVDFKGDKCRYQILFKVPYPSIGSQQVKIRKKNDPEWYNYQTIQPLQQSYGRGVRDISDYCKYYILDEDFEALLHEYKYLFNEYFLEGIQ